MSRSEVKSFVDRFVVPKVILDKYKPQKKPKLIPLPCPFCGKKPKLAPKNPEKDGAAWGEVYCANIWCAAQPKVNDGQNIADGRGSGAYIDAAIERWNRRA